MAGLAVSAAAAALLTAGCSSGGAAGRDHGQDHDHGTVVGHLDIPFVPAHLHGPAQVVTVSLLPGQRFSVLVQTSDGPYAWNQTRRPDPWVVRSSGDFDRGTCASGLVGCRVPYYHTLVARNPGTTVMTWNYRDFGCPEHGPAPKDRHCLTVTHVRFRIVVTALD